MKAFRLTFTGFLMEFDKISQVKAYLRHHRAVADGMYSLHKSIKGEWVRWDVYRNCRV